MSQIITIKRQIIKEELCLALDKVEGLSLGEEHIWGFTINSSVEPNCLVTFSNGNLEAI